MTPRLPYSARMLSGAGSPRQAVEYADLALKRYKMQCPNAHTKAKALYRKVWPSHSSFDGTTTTMFWLFGMAA